MELTIYCRTKVGDADPRALIDLSFPLKQRNIAAFEVFIIKIILTNFRNIISCNRGRYY
jgi:hypothetical protein